MPPKRRNKGKCILKYSKPIKTSKEPQTTPSKEKILSSAIPIKSWIEMVEEEQETTYKSISSEQQVKEWMESITKSPELMLALQGISKSKALSQIPEEEKPISKEITKPSSSQSQNIVLSGESSSSQIVLSQPTLSKKTSDWYDKTHFQNILTMEDGFYHLILSKQSQSFFLKAGFLNHGI